MRFREYREQFLRAAESAAAMQQAAELDSKLVGQVQRELTKADETRALQHLMSLPIEAMRDASVSSLRLEPLQRIGLTTVGAVHLASEQQLARIQGISDAGAHEVKSIADAMYRAAAQSEATDLHPEVLQQDAPELLEALRDVDAVRRTTRGSRDDLAPNASRIREALTVAKPLTSRLRWWFTAPDARAKALDASLVIASLLGDPAISTAVLVSQQALNVYRIVKAAPVQADFEQRAAEYYAVLEDVSGRTPRLEHRHLSDELLDHIQHTELDTSKLDVTLRRYQVFGSRFALAQKRVMLGDEMGLGKTIQAIAVLQQRHIEGATRFLVVCPASVLVNWQREIEKRSQLTVTKIHGEEQLHALTRWQSIAGIALTTFDTLKSLPLTNEQIAALDVDTVVVDEAHYVKNPESGRTREIRRWLDSAPRALLMTGTPLENRVNEFVDLAALLDETFAGTLRHAALAVGAQAFRIQAAPIYLRRNTQEVLRELPELIGVDEYCTWDGADHANYVDAVAKGNLMAMRQAGMLPRFDGAIPSKMERLIELVDEAFDAKQKVLIFSYFREPMRLIKQHLGDKALGPITGDVTPAQRQAIVDQFTNAPQPLALIGQVQAAGTGLNLQAASVVILCEPQIKPSLEVQAIARAHRMGQTRTVQVHRLVIPDSVDDTMLTLLAGKQAEFNAFARESELANATGAAKDRSEEALAKVIVMEERRRLGLSEQ